MPEAGRPRAGTLIPLSWWRDPLVLTLTVYERDLYVRLMSYSADEKTDGWLTGTIATMLAAADPQYGTAALDGLIAKNELVAGADSTLLLRRWHDFNLSRAEVESRRRQRAEAGQVGGRNRIAKAARDPVSGRVLPEDPDVAPGDAPDEPLDDPPDERLGKLLDVHQSNDQTQDQTRLPSPVSRVPSAEDRAPVTQADPDSSVISSAHVSRERSPSTATKASHEVGNQLTATQEPGARPAAEDLPADRPDVTALCRAKAVAALTPAQKHVLDEIADRHDVTGPQWAAEVFARAPAGADPMDVLLATDRDWKAARRADADQAELTWMAEKDAERQSAASVTDRARAVLTDAQAEPAQRAVASAWLKVAAREATRPEAS